MSRRTHVALGGVGMGGITAFIKLIFVVPVTVAMNTNWPGRVAKGVSIM
jgi:hypothetical protein